MYATVRRYKGVPTAVDQLMPRRKDIEAIIRQSPGFQSYQLIQTQDGLITVTICDDRNGAETSNRNVAAWLKDNMPGVITNPPEITQGDVKIQLGSPAGVRA